MARESPRSCHAKISCRLVRLSRARRATSRDRLRRNNRDKGAHDLSSFSVRLNLDPNNGAQTTALDRKSTRLNSSHVSISYAVFCLKKKKKQIIGKADYHI